VSLDDSGDIVLFCQDGNCPLGLGGQSGTPGGPAAMGKAASSRLMVILVSALVAPAGLAICATGIAAVVLRHRRKRAAEQEAAGGTGETGGTRRRRGRRPRREAQLEGRAGTQEIWRSTDGVPWPANTSSNALYSSNAGSDESSSSGGGNHVLRLQPGETGFGSMPGGMFQPVAMLPPPRDSVDGPGSHEGQSSGYNRRRWSIASSLTGMATNVALALHLR
jgi:hypothetical protein